MLENYQYTSPEINEESQQLLQEYAKIMDALGKGEYPISHCFFIIYSEDKPKGYWGTDHIPDLLARFRKDIIRQTTTLYFATLWNDRLDTPTDGPIIDNEEGMPEATLSVIRGGTLVNLTDFIYGCCLSEALLKDYLLEISTLMLTPIEGANKKDFKNMFYGLENVTRALANKKHTH